jgi:hypothetical protein
MRVLTSEEIQQISGAAFIEGMVTDDFAVGGAFIGVVAVVGLGVFARMRYNQETISLKDAISCTLLTAVEGIKYGIMVDGASYVAKCDYKGILNFIR